jgi:hypothetical protein
MSRMPNIHLNDTGKTPTIRNIAAPKAPPDQRARPTMTAIVSGSYHQPLLSRAVSAFFGRIATPPLRRTAGLRQRIVEANRVRALAASVEMDQPGFAADLYAAASRHEMAD